MEKKELVKYLKSMLAISRRKLAANIQKKEYKKAILAHTPFLPDSVKWNQRCWHLIYDVNEQPKCKKCQEKVPAFNNNKWGYLDYCSIKCQRNSEAVIENLKKSLQEKYGEGITNAFQAESVKTKSKKTMLEKYGVEHNSQGKFKEQRRKACLKKYGVDHYMSTQEFRERCRKKCIERYGVSHYSKTKEFREKYKNWSMEKYGVEHPFQDPEYLDEMLQKMHKCKKYTMPSGRVISIMGYEHFALDDLLKIYNEEDLCVTKGDIADAIGTIYYEDHDGRERVYFPDFYIKKTNTVVEVKSTWTFDRKGTLHPQENTNLRKKDACLDQGFNFEFMIYDRKGDQCI